MTNPYLDDDNDGLHDDDQQQRENHNLKQLREKAKKADRLEGELSTANSERDQARRELAMFRAGVDLDSPAGKLLAKAYDGEPTVEAVTKFAVDYGVIDPPQQMQEEVTQEQALARLAGAHQGATGPTATGKEISSDTYASWDAAKRAAFRKNHPRESEILKRGGTVPAISGF